jgi:hypothetical protein
MSYIILMSITFVIGVIWSSDLMPIFKKVEQKFLGFLASRLSK